MQGTNGRRQSDSGNAPASRCHVAAGNMADMIVATWNLENLFLPGTEFGPSSEEVYEEKLQGLADVIAGIDPDVLAVQEVGSPEACDDLVDRLPGEWETTLSELPDERGIRVGFLSRLAVEDSEEVHAFRRPLRPVQADDAGATSDGTSRGLLRIRVAGVELVTGHLKSKLLRFPGDRFTPRDEGERARFGAYALFQRAGEAVLLRSFADRVLPERPLVVLGDLNDEVQAATTQILLGPPGSEIGTAGFEQPDRGDPYRLWNLAPLIPAERRYTRVFRGRRELIDHLLVSHGLVRRVTRADTTPEPPPSITEFPDSRLDARVSDHRPLFAELATAG
jgi:endonuclease/exonuclease/phosphatase family metal-dependent hydrolase